ncbi:MAG: phosphatase [Lysobacteraceae bacterium SCN 69-123]|jgi:acid phosphatase (class A)|uniref:acid phosphatase n=1 Tax=Stenotrophomonas acidaminiphila TaxID=128780 RepID=UPI0008687CB5|nr:phosphatase PAP2 family protein [Stenotrophomonas acidaminiphila]MBN8800606.1 phosphatase PAP2 family protein [Stenotrophomonas acidaminiphila]MDF9440432.1 phosphatase PAP2 family protein [Stenotrophomonas acidaminiphila]ODU47082.1 MAG: phosphatase [Xanthomonadaceae bacterium SCN 69-123]OJY72868.1 MAG: phosphatase [Stenotrophomonas sp. 69-14]
MSRSPFPLRLGAASVLAAALAACASTPAPVARGHGTPAEPAPTGYLQGAAIPDSQALSPPPPAPGSAWAALDEAIARQATALRGSARFAQAGADADLRFPAGAGQFSCALGVAVDSEHTPALYRLLQRSLIDASAATRAAKNHYRRPRPFMVNGQPTCTPDDEPHLRGSGSYPSGHTAIGWAWALILSEIAPERATALLERGRNYGQSRLVCNVHWYSDVQQAQTLGAATVARLHDNPGFVADLGAARRELAAARVHPRPLPRDCAAEAAALATGLPDAR